MSPRLATFVVFAINGAMVGTWVAHIPWLQDRLGLSKATLGVCLLCMAAGAFVSMPLTGHVLDRVPSASVTRWAALVFCLMLPLPLLATSPYTLAPLLFVFGASNGAMDVAMNAHGVGIQERLGRPVMSSLHGGWSVGGFTAAGCVALAATAGLNPRVESLIVGVGLFLLSLWITRRLGASSAHSSEEHGLALPTRPVILIGGLCFLVMLAEGAIGDWSGIYLKHNTGASPATAALAFTAFSLGMAIARLGGDPVNERIGASMLLRAGTATVAIALGGVLLIGHTIPAVVGLVLCGLGIANAVPLLFSAAGRINPPGTVTRSSVHARLHRFHPRPADHRCALRPRRPAADACAARARASHRDGAWRQGAGQERQPTRGDRGRRRPESRWHVVTIGSHPTPR